MKKVVLVGGCFDLIHYGHIVFLQGAKKHGDMLIVALESDENVRKYKGKNRPIHTQQQRKKMLETLRMIDKVISLPPMNSDAEYYDLVSEIHPEVVAITENDPQKENKQKQCDAVGAKLITVTSRLRGHSTTDLIEKLGL